MPSVSDTYHVPGIPHLLSLGEDPTTSIPVLGFEHNGMFIFDPLVSDCGRFGVEPDVYGLTMDEALRLVDLNAHISDAYVALQEDGQAPPDIKMWVEAVLQTYQPSRIAFDRPPRQSSP